MADSIDYIDIVKRAAAATWQHKALWLFGFFLALSGGGGSNASSSFRGSSTSAQGQVDRFANLDWRAYLPIIIALAIVAVVVWIVLLVLRLISEGALVGMAREIARGGSPTTGDGFRVGWTYWLRMLGIDFLIALPILVLVLILVGVGVALAVSIFGTAGLAGGGASASAAAAVFGGACGIFAFIAVAIVLLIPVVIVLGVVGELARRHAVLLDEDIIQSLGDGWRMLRSRFRDVALWWLVMLVVGIVVGLVFGIVGFALVLPGIGLMLLNPIAGVFLLIPGVLVVAFLSGIVQAFTSVAWTDFFIQIQPAAA